MLFLVKLKFRGPVSFGNYSLLDQDQPWGLIHSDTLFSAILNHWVKIDRTLDVLKLIAELDSKDPPFLISSAFPFSDTGYYLPTPMGTGDLYAEVLKDFPYLEMRHFSALAEGQYEQIWKLGHEIPARELFSHGIVPKVTIDRVTGVTNFFQSPIWAIAPNAGLYFILDIKDQSFLRVLESSIRMLGEAGVGADRSTGCGIFDCKIDPVSDDPVWSELLETRNIAGHTYCALSLCCPAADPSSGYSKEALEAASYRIISRTGWVSSSSSWMQVKRRECKMFAEGSIFNSPIKGCIADVTPTIFESEHCVFRYGLGIMVGGVW